MDIFEDKNWQEKSQFRIETERAGVFTFAPKLDVRSLQLILQRVIDAQTRFKQSPLSQVANQLEKEVIVSSVFGTNTIEGGTLNEKETEQILDQAPAKVQKSEEQRVRNIKAAYELVKIETKSPDWQLTLPFIIEIHMLITQQLPDEYNVPGKLRDNPKETITRVGTSEHGGVYKPPQNGRDISALLNTLVDWNRDLTEAGVPALIRAPLFHLYFEWIHPFWDGNGRVGRVLEASILLSDGFRYAPFAQARYYLDEIHHYFTLFNHCRKKKTHTEFVAFFLEGMLKSINRLHDRANHLVTLILFRSHLHQQQETKKINMRQYAIVTELLKAGEPMLLDELRQTPWYQALYKKLTSKTMQRDIRQLRALDLLHLTSDNYLWPGYFDPEE